MWVQKLSHLQVAELAIQGVEKGYFFSKSPDFISNVAIASLAGVAPRIFNVFVESLLQPFYFFLHLWIRWNIDKRILAWRAEERQQKHGKSSLMCMWRTHCRSRPATFWSTRYLSPSPGCTRARGCFWRADLHNRRFKVLVYNLIREVSAIAVKSKFVKCALVLNALRRVCRRRRFYIFSSHTWLM